MRILHTSDWHIGKNLYGRKRYDEFESFFSWLSDTIEEKKVDALLVAGDIFDNSTPGNQAQKIYYRFLCKVASSCCRHVVIIAGNHDSPSFLNAPDELLKALDIHVRGHASEDARDEVIVLKGENGKAELIVCAVPYLRDRDIRISEAGESVEEKDSRLQEGIRAHYAAVAQIAERKRREYGKDIPVVGMGHLFSAGGMTIDGDGVRELYVGSLARVNAGVFSEEFNYVALGHLHVPQKVKDSDFIRYCGSPLPMGFGEAGQRKSICLVEFQGRTPNICLVDIPVFRDLERVKGDSDAIFRRIMELSAGNSSAWLEIVYDGEEAAGDLRERLDAAIENTDMEILRVKNKRIIERALESADREEVLEEMDVMEVFERCLKMHEIPEEQRENLRHVYGEILQSLDVDAPEEGAF